MTPVRKKWREANRGKLKAWYKKYHARSATMQAGSRRRNKTRRNAMAEWFHGLKLGLACSRCPETHPACLDFHHRDPTTKAMDVARMVRDRYGKSKILEEIAKCDVLCQNCHRVEEATRRAVAGTRHATCSCLIVGYDSLDEKQKRACSQFRCQDRRYLWYNLQKSGKICGCGEGRPECLDFHHVDAETKTKAVSEMLRLTQSTIESEIAKCVLMCGNCHRKHHCDE